MTLTRNYDFNHRSYYSYFHFSLLYVYRNIVSLLKFLQLCYSIFYFLHLVNTTVSRKLGSCRSIFIDFFLSRCCRTIQKFLLLNSETLYSGIRCITDIKFALCSLKRASMLTFDNLIYGCVTFHRFGNQRFLNVIISQKVHGCTTLFCKHRVHGTSVHFIDLPPTELHLSRGRNVRE